MIVTKAYCDHCGKVLDEMHDYVDTEITVKDWWKADLCNTCIKELNKIAKDFCKKGGE